jgi:hypothetical protein
LGLCSCGGTGFQATSPKSSLKKIVMNKFATLATFAFILLGKSIVRSFDLMVIKLDFELNTIGTFQ